MEALLALKSKLSFPVSRMWQWCVRRSSSAVAGTPGGDQRFSKTEAHAELIMTLLEENGDITLAKSALVHN
ncbi:hypothetical protein NOVOSPHI9U_200013 [Novosphingobium sp. 9U]|nr:hypothetical protein NOVOSPHI9U_200013 [Novosphingobium sp. 9U]